MISKNLSILFIVFGTSFCTHSEERISEWSELDGISNMECSPLRIFDQAESIKTRDLDVSKSEQGWLIKVTHTDRKGQIETRIGNVVGQEELPQWTKKIFTPSLAYYTENDYVFLEGSKVYHLLEGEKHLILDNPEEENVKIYDLGVNTVAILFGDNIEVMSRKSLNSKFSSLNKFTGIKKFKKTSSGVKWQFQKNNVRWAAGIDSKGLWSSEIKAPKAELLRSGDAIVSYELSEGDDGGPATIALGSNKKIWQDGYLRVLELPRQFVLQRWVDSESVVELLDVDNFKISALGVLPENWWIRGSLDDLNSQFLVEGKDKWQICAWQR